MLICLKNRLFEISVFNEYAPDAPFSKKSNKSFKLSETWMISWERVVTCFRRLTCFAIGAIARTAVGWAWRWWITRTTGWRLAVGSLCICFARVICRRKTIYFKNKMPTDVFTFLCILLARTQLTCYILQSSFEFLLSLRHLFSFWFAGNLFV